MGYSAIKRVFVALIGIAVSVAPVAVSAQTRLRCITGVAGCVLPITDPAAVKPGQSVSSQPRVVPKKVSSLWPWLLAAGGAGGLIAVLASHHHHNQPVSP